MLENYVKVLYDTRVKRFSVFLLLYLLLFNAVFLFLNSPKSFAQTPAGSPAPAAGPSDIQQPCTIQFTNPESDFVPGKDIKIKVGNLVTKSDQVFVVVGPSSNKVSAIESETKPVSKNELTAGYIIGNEVKPDLYDIELRGVEYTLTDVVKAGYIPIIGPVIAATRLIAMAPWWANENQVLLCSATFAIVNPGETGGGKIKDNYDIRFPPCASLVIPTPNAAAFAGRQVSTGMTCNSVYTGFGIPISTDPAGLAKALFGILLSISGAIAVFLIISGGYKLMISSGNPDKVKEAKETITSAIVGLLFIIFALVLLELITVDILHLKGFGH